MQGVAPGGGGLATGLLRRDLHGTLRWVRGGGAGLVSVSRNQSTAGRAPAPLPGVAYGEGQRRARPRLWHHDYLHLRPLALDLRRVLGEAHGQTGTGMEPWRVLDLGCGGSPYRDFFPASLDRYIGVDLDQGVAPAVVARCEALPFAGAAFDGILATQVLQFTDEPQGVVAEIRRLTRPGGVVWLTCHGAWPREGTSSENRYGEPDLARLFSGFERVTVTAAGGYLGFPFLLFNLALREVVRAASRRLGSIAGLLWVPAVALFTVSNLLGRLLERLAAGGPLRPFLSHLDGSLPTNYLVVAERGA